jgi:hypothetical protein
MGMTLRRSSIHPRSLEVQGVDASKFRVARGEARTQSELAYPCRGRTDQSPPVPGSQSALNRAENVSSADAVALSDWNLAKSIPGWDNHTNTHSRAQGRFSTDASRMRQRQGTKIRRAIRTLAYGYRQGVAHAIVNACRAGAKLPAPPGSTVEHFSA